jgi:hypothetical protein
MNQTFCADLAHFAKQYMIRSKDLAESFLDSYVINMKTGLRNLLETCPCNLRDYMLWVVLQYGVALSDISILSPPSWGFP